MSDDFDGTYVAAGVTVASTDNSAIVGTASQQQVQVEGMVGADGVAVSLGDSGAEDYGNLLTVGAGARLVGYGYTGAGLTGYNSELHNSGLIYGGKFGVWMTGVRDTGHSTLENDGRIQAVSFGVYRPYSTEDLVLNNSGTIKGAVASFYAHDSNATEEITNTGTMIGKIELGDGDDLYDGASGHVRGEVYGGNGMDRLFGGTDDDVLNGGRDDDFLDGGKGGDVMNGGKGSDAYLVDDADDVIIDAVESDVAPGKGRGLTPSGTDTVYAGVSYTLEGGVSVEVLQADAGTTGLTLKGNAFAQTIVGGGGKDTLKGEAGADVLNGGKGSDTLSGGTGSDVFFFDGKLGSGNVDTIGDFSNAAGSDDSIQLENGIFTKLTKGGVLASGMFAANKDGLAKDADDFIVYETDTGKLFYDADGSGAGKAVQFALLGNKAALTADDLFVV
jgi:Ca2+-binding RTX toxin-like protein